MHFHTIGLYSWPSSNNIDMRRRSAAPKLQIIRKRRRLFRIFQTIINRETVRKFNLQWFQRGKRGVHRPQAPWLDSTRLPDNISLIENPKSPFFPLFTNETHLVMGFRNPWDGKPWMICIDLNQKLLLISSLLNMRLMSPYVEETISWHPLSWIGQFYTVHTLYIWINKGIWMESSTAGSFGCICALLTLLLTQYYQHMFVLASEKVNQALK